MWVRKRLGFFFSDRQNMAEKQIETDEKDYLNRTDYADGLTQFISKLKKGVIAVDGEWGVGKSWLARHIQKKIDAAESASTIWLDTFEADWDDDPSLSIIAELVNQTSEDDKTGLRKKFALTLSHAVPTVAKVLTKSAGKIVGIDEDLLNDIADGIRAVSAAHFSQRLEDLATRRKTLSNLKSLLSECIEQSIGQKVVVFVDELDRCSPEYAIRFLERIKHLFDLDGVVYVLFWNRQQIQNTVEAFYGRGTNSAMYLDKFVDFPLHLPRSHVRGERPMRGVFMQVASLLEDDQRNALDENVDRLNSLATLLSLNARECKRLAIWWVMSPNRNAVVLETWLLGLKVKHPTIFADLRDNKPAGHHDAKQILDYLIGNYRDDFDKSLLVAIREIHDCHINNSFDNISKEAIQIINNRYGEAREALPSAIRRLETFN